MGHWWGIRISRPRRVRLTLEPLEPRDTPAAPATPSPLAASGPADGTVTVYTAVPLGGTFSTNAPTTVTPFPGFAGQVRTAFADVNGDGTPDLIAATGPGGPALFTVRDGRNLNTVLVAPTDPFGDPAFTGGAFVAAGAIDANGQTDVVLSPDQGGGPRVVIFSIAGTTPVLRASFYGINDPSFRGGARVAVGDFNADGFADVAVAAGFLGGPRVSVYSGLNLFAAAAAGTPLPTLVPDFFAFDGADAATLRNGVFVAAGDINGDGFADLIFGGGPGGSPRVLVLSGRLLTGVSPAAAQAAPLANFFAGDPNGRGGVRVAAKPFGIAGRGEVAAASGENTESQIGVYLGTTLAATTQPTPAQTLDPYGQVLPGGVYVG